MLGPVDLLFDVQLVDKRAYQDTSRSQGQTTGSQTAAGMDVFWRLPTEIAHRRTSLFTASLVARLGAWNNSEARPEGIRMRVKVSFVDGKWTRLHRVNINSRSAT